MKILTYPIEIMFLSFLDCGQYLSLNMTILRDACAVEHEVLEREAGRLRGLYQQQQKPLTQQQQQISSSHRRAKSRDLDQQLANLSLKIKETSSGQDSLSSQLHM